MTVLLNTSIHNRPLLRLIYFFWICMVLTAFSVSNDLICQSDKESQRGITVREIKIEGLQRTKEFLIHKEINIKQGDIIPFTNLLPKIKENRILLEKTSLFKEVVMTIDNWENDSIDITIEVQERWYYLIYPYLRLADRNFNEWITEHNADLGRLIYGATLYLENIRGRNEQLKIRALFGFNQQFGAQFSSPYFTKKSNFGYKIGAEFKRTREVAYTTTSNKLEFVRTDEYAFRELAANSSITFRKGHFLKHAVHLNYFQTEVSDTILELNPSYFNNGQSRQRMFELSYSIKLDKASSNYYPLTGYNIELEFSKKGLGIYDDVNLFEIRAFFSQYYQLGKRFHGGHKLTWKFRVGNDQPYFLQKALGYKHDVVRGYELYVIDGQQFFLIQNDLKIELFSFKVAKPIISLKQFNNIPFQFFLRPHIDFGYVVDSKYTETNSLRNKWLIGYGAGIDIVTYYDYAISINFSINRMAEKGLYLHINF